MQRTSWANLLRGLRKEGYHVAAWIMRARLHGIPEPMAETNLRVSIAHIRNHQREASRGRDQ